MAAEIDFQPYLQSISTHYAQWEKYYTLTDAETKVQQKNEAQPWKTPFDFGLMVQAVQRDRSVGVEGSDGEPQPKEKIERFPVLEGIRKFVKEHRQVLLVGRPGSGKSTTLARLLLEEARNVEDPPSPLKKGEPEVKVPLFKGDLGRSKGLGDSASLIPVLVELRFLSDSTILDRIQAFFQRHGLQLDRTQIEDLLFHQRLLLLMDGLNELPSEAARLDVAKFRQDYPKVSMIFTTRDLSLGGDFGLEKKLEMQPLTEVQMQAFVRSYVPEQAEAMLRQLKDRLREFGQTPLLLWMLCGLFRQTGQIPANLGEVFRAFTQGYERNLKADVPVESDRRWWPELLQELAFWMMRGAPFGKPVPAVDVEFRVAISRAEACQIFTAFLQNKEAQAKGAAQRYLDDLLRHHLIQPNGEQVEFRHQLLQEYYAAEYLLARWEQMSELEFKRDYLNYLKWTEAIALMLSLMQSETQAERVAKLALDIDWELGSRLAGEVKPEFQEKTVGFIEALEVPNWLKAHYLATTRSRKAISGMHKLMKASDSRVKGSAIYLLVETGFFEAVVSEVPKGSDPRFVPIPVLGTKNQGFQASPPQLSEHSLPKGQLNLLKDSESDMHRSTVDALSKIESEAAVSGLLKLLEDPDSNVRIKATDALSKIAKKYIETIALYLPHLLALIPTKSGQDAHSIIRNIQENCKFYNYDITQTTQTMKLFFSYTHKDESLRDELAKHLSLLKRQNIITDWHDRNITAGTDWAQAIDDNLNTANIILLLISSDFLASDYCYDTEMTRALEHHNQGTARVIPIILRPCDWHSAPFGKLQALPIEHAGGAKPVTKWDDQDEAFTHIAQGIRKAIAELQQRNNTQPKG
jgi:energy-coupling factor transporter ATP-binding protein EcfA2